MNKPSLIRIPHFNPLNAELNPICCLLALLGAHHFFHISRIRVKSLTLKLLMSYIYIYIYIYIYDISSLRVKYGLNVNYLKCVCINSGWHRRSPASCHLQCTSDHVSKKWHSVRIGQAISVPRPRAELC